MLGGGEVGEIVDLSDEVDFYNLNGSADRRISKSGSGASLKTSDEHLQVVRDPVEPWV